MDKKKKKARALSKLPLTKRYSIKIQQDVIFEIPNVKTLSLHPNTQNMIGCKIGTDITPENPWIYVPKSKIEDHMFLHEKSSEFICIKELIESYPKDEIFLGSIDNHINEPAEFGICLTMDAVESVQEKINCDKLKIMNKVRNSLFCQSRQWYSYGSEPDVESDMILNNRELFSIVLESSFPITTDKIRFTLDLASPITKHYVELLPGRHNYINILRRRIDKKIQVSPVVIDKSVQTNLTNPVNKLVQYEYSVTAKYLNENEYKRLSESVRNLMNMIENALVVNYYIHLHEDQYFFEDLFKGYSEYLPRDIIQMQDVRTCQHMKITSVTWNPVISGLIAAAYSKVPPLNFLVNSEPKYMETTENYFNDSLVLLWSYSNSLYPKLYFHAPREVTSVSFCPYNQNILVGGCINGQVIVWDMEHSYNALDTRDVLTTSQINNQIILQKHMNWFKPPPDKKNIFPTLISEIDTSHSSPITNIQWLPSQIFMTKNGKFNVPDPGQEKLQFLTCSLEDSYVLTWNIKYQEDNLTFIPMKSKKRLQRLDKIPESLTADKSKLRDLNLLFRPIYRLKLYNRQARTNIFATQMLLKNQSVKYGSATRETFDDTLRRTTYYSSIESPITFDLNQNLILTTATGYITNNSWTGYDFDQGQKVNEEICTTIAYTNIHDGPLLSCLENPYFNNIFLVIGGRVFSIWDSTLSYPILWRKSKCQYVSGIWSQILPFALMVVRRDQVLEIWNVAEDTFKPIRLIKCNGNTVVNLFYDNRITEPSKQTFIITDKNGAIRVSQMQQNQLFSTENVEIKEVNSMLKHLRRRKNYLSEWGKKLTEKLKKMLQDIEEIDPGKIIGVDRHEEQATNLERSFQEFIKKSSISELLQKKELLIHKNDWQERQEMIMYKILLDQRKLNLAEIEKNKVPLMKLINEQKQQQKRIRKIIRHKNIVFENEKVALLKQSLIKSRRKISVDFSPEFVKLLKENYMDSYQIEEQKSLFFIKSKPFRYIFEWSDFLNLKKGKGKLGQGDSGHNLLSGKMARLRRANNSFLMDQQPTCSYEMVPVTDDQLFFPSAEDISMQRRKSIKFTGY